MNVREAIQISIDTGKMISAGYLSDLTDDEMMKRPCPGCNHVNWQVGHLLASERSMIEKVAPGSMPELPAGFAEKYSAETATSDNPADFHTKAELMAAFEAMNAATIAALARMSDADFDKPTGVEYAPNVASMFSMQGSHWLMHAGQWAVVRRQCGRAPMF